MFIASLCSEWCDADCARVKPAITRERLVSAGLCMAFNVSCANNMLIGMSQVESPSGHLCRLLRGRDERTVRSWK